MSAEILQQAADRLDELAGAATPEPWHHNPGGFVEMDPFLEGGGYNLIADTGASEPDAAYIAAMHPGVGKALAAWLRGMAETWGRIEDELRGLEGVPTVEQVYGYDLTDALAAANAILGGAT